MNYVKIIDGVRHCKPLSKIVLVNGEWQTINPTEEMVIADGWVKEEPIIEEISEEEIARNNAADEIEELKNSLTASDYKIIKCMEAYLCGEDLPYDINLLHAERNLQRQKINELGNI